MFGMGFMEIFLIAVVAIIALGPEKLPTAMVDIAKFLKKFKSGIDDAKSTLDNELNIAEMKEEAAKYKAQIEEAKNTLNVKQNLNLGLNEIINEDKMPSKDNTTKKEEGKKEEKVSLKEPKTKTESAEKEQPKKKKKEDVEKTASNDDLSDKFKVEFEDFDGTEELK